MRMNHHNYGTEGKKPSLMDEVCATAAGLALLALVAGYVAMLIFEGLLWIAR